MDPFIRKHKVFGISRTLKLSKLKDRRVSSKLISHAHEVALPHKYSTDITA